MEPFEAKLLEALRTLALIRDVEQTAGNRLGEAERAWAHAHSQRVAAEQAFNEASATAEKAIVEEIRTCELKIGDYSVQGYVVSDLVDAQERPAEA